MMMIPGKEIKCDSLCGQIHIPHHLTKYPGQLVFRHDMILNVKHEANWEYIQKWKQNLIKENDKAGNGRRSPHTYEFMPSSDFSVLIIQQTQL